MTEVVAPPHLVGQCVTAGERRWRLGPTCEEMSGDPEGCVNAAQNSGQQWLYIIAIVVIIYVLYRAYQWISDDIATKAAAKVKSRDPHDDDDD
jgi:hypothetical protein